MFLLKNINVEEYLVQEKREMIVMLMVMEDMMQM